MTDVNDGAVGQPAIGGGGSGNGLPSSIAPGRHAAAVIEPDRPRRILIDAPDGIARQSVLRCVGREAAIAIPRYAAVERPRPQIAGARFPQSEEPAAGNAGSLALAEDGEPDPVETRKAVVGREPQVTVACLTQRADRVRRQAIRRRPGVEAERGQSGSCPNRQRNCQQHAETGDPTAHGSVYCGPIG